jgi:hypothetical protein
MVNFRVVRTLIVSAITMIGMILPNPAFCRASLAGSDETRTLDCAGGPAPIAGANNKVTLRGDCTHLTVLGTPSRLSSQLVPASGSPALEMRLLGQQPMARSRTFTTSDPGTY